MIDSFFDRLTRGIELVLGAALVFAVALNFINVVERYGFDTSIIWSEEVQVYIMIWMAFLGAVVATWRGIHLRMDMLLRRFTPGWQKAVQILEVLTMTVLSGLVVYQSGYYAERMYAIGKVSDVARMPSWIPHSAISVGFALILVIALVRLVRLFRPGAGPLPLTGEEEKAL
jgi:TRAP-type C4-dicarboxylate transport system permease small subunit